MPWRPVALAMLLLPLTASASLPPRQLDGAQLERAIQRLGVVGNVLYVAAHPDDENTRLLAWLANHDLVRAAYLAVTRGDGGQNLIGSEQGPLLGLIRTQELLAARRVDGAEQLFTRALDFGYSKSPDETLATWGHDEILADVVLAIRRFHPDVILTRFSTVPGETHGHHTASAILAGEAFRKAGDSSYHPEQLSLFPAWQPRRLVFNKPMFFARPDEDLSKFVSVDVGGYDALTGTSAGELAAESRSMHKSQGFGVPPGRGPELEYFQVLAGDPIQKTPLDGIDLTWRRVKGGDKLAALLDDTLKKYQPAHPEASIPSLIAARDELLKLPDNPWKADKERELVEVIAQCAGLYVEATAADPTTAPGAVMQVTTHVIDRVPRTIAPFSVDSLRLPDGHEVGLHKPLATNQPLEQTEPVTVPRSPATSNPYWLVDAPEKGRYVVRDPALVGLPENPPPLVVAVRLDVLGHKLELERPVLYSWTDPVAGERHRPIEIAPLVTVTPGAQALMFPDARARELRLVVKAMTEPASGTLRLDAPAGWTVTPASQPFHLAERGAEVELRASIKPPATVAAQAQSATVPALLHATAVLADGRSFDRGLRRIEHPHIPIQTLFPPSETRLVRFDLKHRKTRIGYIPGAGDEVAAALGQVGYDVTVLGARALVEEPLDRFQAIVTGVRAWNVDPRLPFLHDKLMAYVEKGGTLVVQYNTNNRLAKLSAPIGPYPFTIGQTRVTDENAPITRDHVPLLREPNAIGDADFTGWVQERGLYFAEQFDPRYETPLTMADPGEKPTQGSLLVGKYGKGVFVYTGLAFFRELPAGVPGAFRLFANLLDHGGR